MVYSYTDWHDVDEESRMFAAFGGAWVDGGLAGITQRYVAVPWTTGEIVASRKKNK